MSARDRISKLEALLSRITARSASPRVEAAPKSARATAAVRPPVPAARPAAPATVRVEPAEIELDAAMLDSAPPPRTPASFERQPVAEEPSPSRERLVAAPPAHDQTDAEALPPVALKGEAPETAAEEDAGPTLEVGSELTEEEHEELPASSRRPIAMEPPLAELAFGDAAPAAPQTPPPESGRQMASSPPPDLDFDGDFTGVHTKPAESDVAIIKQPSTPPPAAHAESARAAQDEPLVPEVKRASLDAHGQAATFTGATRTFKPSTFGELLDATLGL